MNENLLNTNVDKYFKSMAKQNINQSNNGGGYFKDNLLLIIFIFVLILVFLFFYFNYSYFKKIKKKTQKKIKKEKYDDNRTYLSEDDKKTLLKIIDELQVQNLNLHKQSQENDNIQQIMQQSTKAFNNDSTNYKNINDNNFELVGNVIVENPYSK